MSSRCQPVIWAGCRRPLAAIVTILDGMAATGSVATPAVKRASGTRKRQQPNVRPHGSHRSRSGPRTAPNARLGLAWATPRLSSAALARLAPGSTLSRRATSGHHIDNWSLVWRVNDAVDAIHGLWGDARFWFDRRGARLRSGGLSPHVVPASRHLSCAASISRRPERRVRGLPGRGEGALWRPCSWRMSGGGGAHG